MTDTDRQTTVGVDEIEQFARDLEDGDFDNVRAHLNAYMCCTGWMCGCKGATVGEYLAHELRTASVRIMGDKDRVAGRAPPPAQDVIVRIATERAAYAAGQRDMRKRAAQEGKVGWVSANYDVVGVADADVAMRLCEHVEATIRALPIKETE